MFLAFPSFVLPSLVRPILPVTLSHAHKKTYAETKSMRRTTMKLALVAEEKTHQAAATEANASLPPEQHLSEHDITRLVTGRTNPTPEQAAALARVLGRSTVELFASEVKP